MVKKKTVTVSVELSIPADMSREQISDIIKVALKPYKPFIEDVGD